MPQMRWMPWPRRHRLPRPLRHPDFTHYLKSLAGHTLTIKRTKGVDFSPYGYNYTGQVAADGSIVLSATDKTAPNSSITIAAGSLAGRRYLLQPVVCRKLKAPAMVAQARPPANHLSKVWLGVQRGVTMSWAPA